MTDENRLDSEGYSKVPQVDTDYEPEFLNNLAKTASILSLSNEANAPKSLENISNVFNKQLKVFSNDYVAAIESSKEQFTKMSDINLGGSPRQVGGGFVDTVTRLLDKSPSYLAEKVRSVPNIELKDVTRFFDHFGNQITEESGIGNVVQAGMRQALTTGKIDPNFNPTKDMLYEDITKGLDSEDIKMLIEDYSYNREDFINVGLMMQARNNRISEMNEYSKSNPVLNAAGFLGSLLTDAAIMSPVTTAIAAQGAATLTGGSLKSLSTAQRLGYFAGAELVEQGGQELAWSAFKKDYEFSLPIFMAGITLGVGVRKVTQSVELDRMVRSLIKNEDGFIKLGKAEAEEFVNVVAKEADDKLAVQLAERIVELKTNAAERIRKDLLEENNALSLKLSTAKDSIKKLDKGTSEYKKAKSEIQKLTRRTRSLAKKNQLTIKQIANGSHPQLQAVNNPEMALDTLAKELGIPLDKVKTPDAAREFLGIKSGKFAESVTIDGEKGYELVLNNQLDELSSNSRINANQFLESVSTKMTNSGLDTSTGLARYLKESIDKTASTDSALTKYVFNKGNLVNSENTHVRGFYNWLAPDNSGRAGASHIRAGETKVIYNNRYFGSLMENYKGRGTELLKHINAQNGIIQKARTYVDFHQLENVAEPIFKDRLLLSKADFERKYPDAKIREIADRFANDYNKLNKMVSDDAIKAGVENAGAYTDDFIHRAWDSSKARLMNTPDLEDAIFRGMRSSLLNAGLDVDEKVLMKEAKNFTFGIVHKDVTKNIKATQNYIDSLKTFLKGLDDDGLAKIVTKEVTEAEAKKAISQLGELGSRADIDLSIKINNTNNMTLADLLEGNFINTMKTYNSRMAARTAAAEHGIKDIKLLDEWKFDAIEAERKRLIAAKDPDINSKVDYLDKVMTQDINSFKFNSHGTKGDILENDSRNVVRLLRKLTAANLMGKVGIASLAEFGQSVANVGMYNATREFGKALSSSLRRNHFLRSANENIISITDDMAALTGIGFGDIAFNSRGISKAEQIYKNGFMSNLEGVIDSASSVTKSTFGWIETTGRRATANAIAIKWGRHFQGMEKGGLIDTFMSGGKTTNRTLENAGLGTWVTKGDTKVFQTNSNYDLIKDNYLKHVSFDEHGGVKALNLDKWDSEARDNFRDVVKLQTNHIYVDPDSTTSAYWQNTEMGRILNQFRTFTVNANSKVAGYTAANLVNGIQHHDMDEVLKFANQMFWATTMGTFAVALRDELKAVGTGESGLTIERLMDAPLQEIAIGFSRSSLIGNLDVVNGIGASMFGYDNIFNRSSFTGRDRNFFNLAGTPIGQLGVNAFEGISSLAQGDIQGVGKAIGDITPFKRQLFIQQAINYINEK